MFTRAARDFDIDLSSSFIIGDRTVDIKAGIDTGCKTILVNTGYGGKDGKYNVTADYICNDLFDAANLIRNLEKNKIKCIILAGGRGERLRPLTDKVPKPMLLVDGKPILEWQIKLLRETGIRDIIICGHYLFDEIKKYFKDGGNFGVHIDYCYEESPLGTGGAIKNAERFLDSTFLVLYGDEMIDMNIKKFIEFHKKNGAKITMLLHETDHPQDSDLVSIDYDGRVLKLYRRPNTAIPSKLSKSSLYVIEPSVLNSMPEGVFDLDMDFIFKYIEDGNVYGYVTDEFIKDIGTMERLKMVDERIRAKSIKELKEKARIIRKHIIRMSAEAGSGHPGGSLSCADIITVLYFKKMNYDPKNPKWENRDRFVLSKGHAAPALYAALAEAGFFPVNELKNLRKIDSILQGHPSVITPGVEVCSGSLGQGLSVANGMALAGRIDKKDYHVYVLIGDGESQEGQIWEAAMTAAHYKLDNLTAILDRNGLQIDGKTEDIMGLEPLAEKWRSFGWDVIEIDGHSFEELINALDTKTKKPKMIIAYTIKGRGVSFMENNVDFHGKVPTPEETEKALQELGIE
jgi:transketolase